MSSENFERDYTSLFRYAAALEWYCMVDPGSTTSAFAVLFVAFYRPDPYAIFFEEIYETDSTQTSVGIVCPKISSICNRYNPNLSQWRFYYDPAAAWFAIDANARFGSNGMVFVPAPKREGDKLEGLATLDELMLQNRIVMSSQCANTIWEFDNYFKDKKGNFIKKNDHQIDNARYFTKVSYLIIEKDGKALQTLTARREADKKNRQRRHISLAKDLKDDYGIGVDWKQSILKRYDE